MLEAADLSVFKVKIIPFIISYKTEITIIPVGNYWKEGKLETAKVTCSLSVDTNAYKSVFFLDTDHMIKDIENKKLSMQKILHNLKYFAQDVLTTNNTKRIYTSPAASKFETPGTRKQGIINTLYSKSLDSKSKVSKDFLLVNILQSASDDPVSGYKGEGPTDRYIPGQ